jgi:glyoxylase-like metal-dependent hydrolase (beta-lactamase superfamily II)
VFCCLPGIATSELQQVAPDLYFSYDHSRSNSVVLITDNGALVADTGMHPDDAALLLADIRKISAVPIRYVVNSQFHGDHYMGNVVFQREGAIFLSHQDTRAAIEERFEWEVANRPF